mgnify:CR=1 FL=1
MHARLIEKLRQVARAAARFPSRFRHRSRALDATDHRPGGVRPESVMGRRSTGDDAIACTDTNLLQSLVDEASDAILIIGQDGRVLRANPPAAALIGRPVGGSLVEELFDHTDVPAAEQGVSRSEATRRWRTKLIGASGTRVEVEAVLAGPASGLRVLIVRERQTGARARADREQRYRDLFENVVDGVYETTADGRFVSVNPALVAMLGYDSADDLMAVGSARELYADPGQRQNVIAETNRLGELRNAELRLRRKDGAELIVLENARAVRDTDGIIVGYQGTLSDITEMRRAERLSLAARERALVTLGAIADAVITTDRNGRVTYMNPVAETLTAMALADAKGKPLDEAVQLINEADGAPLGDPFGRCGRVDGGSSREQQVVLSARDGRRIPVQESVASLFDAAGRPDGIVMVLHDVSKERRLQNQLAYQASHDALTGLINRREFHRHLGGLIEGAADGETHALLYLDLDQFKTVNDTCGHGAGDELLRQITELIRARVRRRDIVSRLGGDEFGVLLMNCGRARAVEIADSLRNAIRNHRFAWGTQVFDLGVSIGVVEVDGSSESFETVVASADLACYAAKDAGRNRIHVHASGRSGRRRDGMASLRQLTGAMEEGRLQLFFQPIVPVGSQEAGGGNFELLLRLRDRSGELFPPGTFLPAADRYHLMPKLDRWVIKKALGELTARGDRDERAGYTVSVNISGSSLGDLEFLEFLMDALQARQLARGAVCFDISEAVAVSHLDRTRQFIEDVRSFGCEVALDDFGRGLSSFSSLRDLPVDFVKIDGDYVRNICSDAVDHTMVDAIRTVGGALGIRTIAEHVDSAECLAALSGLGIHFAQGCHIAAPAPVANFPRLHRRGGPPKLQLA